MQVEGEEDASDNKVPIRFTGIVNKIMKLDDEFKAVHSSYALSYHPDDPHFVLFVKITDVDTPNWRYYPGQDEIFAIHDPASLFGEEQKDVIGKSYYFVMEMAKKI